MVKGIAYLRLLRPANIVTAFADILAGFGVAAIPLILSYPDQQSSLITSLIILLFTTFCLYGGGVVFNDVNDAEIDKLERPERPIPRGIISKTEATFLALGLLLLGIIAAFIVNFTCGAIATVIAFLCVSYDVYAKPSLLLGPMNMAMCRGGNLLLGIAIIPAALTDYWMLAFIPFVFIFAVTLISKGEVHGSNKQILLIALILYLITILGILMLSLMENFHLLWSLPFILLFAMLAFLSLFKSIKNPEPQKIREAVKIGILCLVILDAAIASGYAGWWYGLLILVLLPISILLAKKFAIT